MTVPLSADDLPPVTPAPIVAFDYVSLISLLDTPDALKPEVTLPVAFLSTVLKMSLTLGKFFSTPAIILSSRYSKE